MEQVPNAILGVALWLRRHVSDDSGQDVAEYAVIMSTVVLLVLGGVSLISSQALDILRKVVAALH